jgi:hypothetical protein
MVYCPFVAHPSIALLLLEIDLFVAATVLHSLISTVRNDIYLMRKECVCISNESSHTDTLLINIYIFICRRLIPVCANDDTTNEQLVKMIE